MEKEYLDLLSETIPSLCLGDEAGLYELIFDRLNNSTKLCAFNILTLSQIWRILRLLSCSRFDWQIHSN